MHRILYITKPGVYQMQFTVIKSPFGTQSIQLKINAAHQHTIEFESVQERFWQVHATLLLQLSQEHYGIMCFL
jgi:hypothetical protein